jgi:hypothetical protein
MIPWPEIEDDRFWKRSARAESWRKVGPLLSSDRLTVLITYLEKTAAYAQWGL